jgi:hypothetical protein
MRAHSRRRILHLLLILLFALSPIGTARAEMLNAEIEHSASLPAVSAPLRAGASFTAASLPQGASIGVWYLIPAWMPGMWHRQVETTVYPPEAAKTITAPVDEGWGYQKDKFGGCWNYHREPNMEQHPGGNYVDYCIIQQKEVLQMLPQSFVVRYRAYTVRVSTPDNVIRQVWQQEEIQRITYVEAGLTKRESSVQFFDESGRPTGSVQAYAFMNLIKPYQQVDFLNGKDLRLDFKAFLAAHGMQNLIP